MYKSMPYVSMYGCKYGQAFEKKFNKNVFLNAEEERNEAWISYSSILLIQYKVVEGIKGEKKKKSAEVVERS